MDYGDSIVGGADVPDVGMSEFIGPAGLLANRSG